MHSVVVPLRPLADYVQNPHILIVGAQKCGKTTLANHILHKLGLGEPLHLKGVVVTDSSLDGHPTPKAVFIDDDCLWGRFDFKLNPFKETMTVVIATQYPLDIPKAVLSTLTTIFLFPDPRTSVPCPCVDKALVDGVKDVIKPYDAFVVDFSRPQRTYSIYNAVSGDAAASAPSTSEHKSRGWFWSLLTPWSWFSSS